MDLHEDSSKNLVTASFELPGLQKEDINIDVHNNRLSVSGESKMSKDYDEHGWAVCERRFGKFSRTLQLPQGVKVCHHHDSLISLTSLSFFAGQPDQSKHEQRHPHCHFSQGFRGRCAQKDRCKLNMICDQLDPCTIFVVSMFTVIGSKG